MATRPTTTTTPRADIMGALEMTTTGFVPIGPQILTPWATKNKRGSLPQIPIAALTHLPDTKRKPKSGANRTTWEYGELTYANITHAHEELDNEEESAEYSDYFNYEVVAAKRGVDIINRRLEYDTVAALHNTTTFTGATGTLAVTDEWDDATNAIPITNVSAGMEAIRGKCGMTADTLQISWTTWRDLSVCNQIRNALQYTKMPDGFIPLDALAGALGVKRVLCPGDGNVYNSANMGLTAVLSEIWTAEYAFLCVTNQSADISAPCIGRTFNWAGGGGMMEVDSYEEPQTESQVIRAKSCREPNVFSAAFGFLFSNITT